MLYTSLASAMAGLLGVAQATLVPAQEMGMSKRSPSPFDLSASWDDVTLFAGVAIPSTETTAAVALDVSLKEAQVEGSIDLGSVTDFLKDPTIRLDLATVKAYVELDLSASAAIFQTVELIASPELKVDLDLVEVDLTAALALDLIVGVGAAVDLTAGFYLSFGEEDFLEISVVTKDIVNSSISGLVTKALPVSVGAEVDLSAEIEIELGLRLRTHVLVEADVELLDLDVLSAGTEVAIWVDLLTQTITLVETDNCALSVKNDFALALGIAVNVDVEVLDVLDISLAPELTITIGSTEGVAVCLSNRGPELPSSPASQSSALETPSGTPVTKTATLSPITTPAPGDVTKTFTTTKEYTITRCLASVPNCPASHTQKVVTSTVESSVYVCPATETGTPTPTATSTKKPVKTITETATTVVPCKPTTSTFTPPATSGSPPPATVTVSESTTVCPVTESETAPATSAPATGSPSASVDVPVYTPTTGVSSPVGAPSSPAAPGVPGTSAPVATPTPGAPGAPSTPSAGVPVYSPKPSSPAVPTWTQPGKNTWTSIATPVVPAPVAPGVPGAPGAPGAGSPGTTYVPTPTVTPTPPAGTPPPVAGAGSVKVGMALAMPIVAAMLL